MTRYTLVQSWIISLDMVTKTDTELQTYLDELGKHGNATKAARAAGMRLATVLDYREADPDFRRAEALAQMEAADALEDAAFSRAVDGVETALIDKEGNVTGYKTAYSDSLLTLLLKGAKPDKYADRNKTELGGPNGGPIALDAATARAKLEHFVAIAAMRKASGQAPLSLLDGPLMDPDDPLLQ